MCANDVVVQGAEPLFFLDYYATGRLVGRRGRARDRGHRRGMYAWRAARSSAARPRRCPACTRTATTTSRDSASASSSATASSTAAACAPGDAVIGLASSGPHSNGYSLIRRLLADTGADVDTRGRRAAASTSCMAPTRIYVQVAPAALLPRWTCTAFAHITGGGLTDNIPRVAAGRPRGAARPARLAARPGVGLDPGEPAASPMPRCIAPSTAASA